MVMTLSANESGSVFYVKRPGAVLDAGSLIATLELDDASLVTKVNVLKQCILNLSLSVGCDTIVKLLCSLSSYLCLGKSIESIIYLLFYFLCSLLGSRSFVFVSVKKRTMVSVFKIFETHFEISI